MEKVLIARGADKDGTKKRGPGYANGLQMATVLGAKWRFEFISKRRRTVGHR
jgi:hypothetical protein